MYAFIKGLLAYSSSTYIHLETHGVGYKIWIPSNIISKLPNKGEEVLLYTTFVVRENAHTLYGFLSEQERDLFELYIDISGVGPRTALSLIGHLSLHQLHTAIQHNDLKPLCKVPGIGRKTAERLIMEIRDKLPNFISNYSFNHELNDENSSFTSFSLSSVQIIKDDPQTQAIKDAISALINLGYNQAAAQKAIKISVQELLGSKDKDLNKKEQITSKDIGDLISKALQHISM